MLLIGKLALLFAVGAKASSQSEPPCSPPKPIDHGLTDWDGKSGVARYACFQGYHLVGPPKVECRYGTWYSDTPVSLPACRPIVCNAPVIENGRLDTGDSVRHRSGEEANVVCNDGFELKTKGRIICKEDGSWQSTEQKEFPACREKPCHFPDDSIPLIPNGTLEINGHRVTNVLPDRSSDSYDEYDDEQGPSPSSKGGVYKPGGVAIYRCRPGFLLVPLSAGKRVCHRGEWEGNMPACIQQEKSVPPRTHCPAPLSISNGYYFTDRTSETPLALPKVSGGTESYERGTIARYHCKEGYALSSFHGQEIYRCMSDGRWSPSVPPVCISMDNTNNNDPLEQVMCPSPPQIPYTDFERVEGWLTSNGAIHGTVLEYSCRVGFRDSRTPCLPTRRTCHAGKWVGRKPTCVPFDYCDRPPIISHGFMKTTAENAYHVLSEVQYECHPGYRMKGSNALRCLATGCWTPNELPECIREDLYDSGWSNSDDSPVALIATLVSLCVVCALAAILTTACLVVVCRRKGHHPPHPPSGPAHWSTTVTVTPECRPRSAPVTATAATATNGSVGSNGSMALSNGQTQLGENVHSRARPDQDRMALIAFADGVQQVTLPSYEEALRESSATSTNGSIPEYDNPLVNGHMNGLSNGRMTNGHGLTNGHHQPQQQQQQQHFRFHSNGRVSRTAHPAVSAVNGRSRSRHPAGNNARYAENGVDSMAHQATYPAASLQQHRRRREHDALSDSASHHSIHVWPTHCNGSSGGGGGGRHHRRSGGSTSGSSSTGSGSNMTNGAVNTSTTCSNSNNSSSNVVPNGVSNNSQSTSLRSSHSSNSTEEQEQQQHQQQQQHLQRNNSAQTPTPLASQGGDSIQGGGSTSQTPSCRALAGSLGSFDAISTGINSVSSVNADGVPLLEEHEGETEGSNSSVISAGDTGSATYSEGSSKN